jgi:putative membrane protein
MKSAISLVLLGALVIDSGCAARRHSPMGAAGSGSQTLSGTETGTVGPQEAGFARQACQSGAAEGEIGKLALNNTKNKAVRKFAQNLVEERTQAEKELAEIFARKRMRPEATLAPNLKSTLDHLARLRGSAFDQAFKEQVIKYHESAIRGFQDQADKGSDPDLRSFASRQLPQLRINLAQAQRLPVSSAEAGKNPEPEAGALNNAIRGLGNPPANTPR